MRECRILLVLAHAITERLNMWFDDSLEQLKLDQAEQESLSTGKLTPLVKEELKFFIQSRRLSEGKDELAVHFDVTPNKPQQDLGTEEKEKLERRREQNRRASQKLRGKKKMELHNLLQSCADLERRNKELLTQIRNLQAERATLYEKIRTLLPDNIVFSQREPMFESSE